MKKFVLIFLCASLFTTVLSAQEADYAPEEADWNNRFVYAGLSLLWVPRIYTAAGQSNNIASLGLELTADIHLLRFLSVRAGAELSQDMIIVVSNEIVLDRILDFPVNVAYVLRPLPNLMLEPYLGINYNLSLQGNTNPYPFSWNVGAELGIKTGLGILTIDPRFSRDFGNSSLPYGLKYQRSTIHVGVGFKIGFLERFF